MTDEGDGSADDETRDRPTAEEISRDVPDPSADEDAADIAAGADVERSGNPVASARNADAAGDREGAERAGRPDAGAGPTTDGSNDDPTVDASTDDATADGEPAGDTPTGTPRTEDRPAAADHDPGVPEDVRTYDRFTKIDGGTYERANEFLRERTYITAREWAIARLCADFRTETGVEMTKIGEHLPELVPFMTDTYTPQAVNQARAAFEEKVRKSGATFLYGAMSDFFTAEELDDVMYEATEVAKFLLEVEGVDLSVEDELAAEEDVSEVMREVREHSAALRHDEVVCPECGHHVRPGEE